MKNLIRYAILVLVLLVSIGVSAKTLRIAIIDTGFDTTDDTKSCPNESVNFTYDSMYDTHGHGRNINYLVNTYAKGSDYCLINIKYYSTKVSESINQGRFIQAFKYLNSIDLDIVNISAGGVSPNDIEKSEIIKLLDKKVLVLAAAGNNSELMTKDSCHWFPACYDERIVVVGAKGLAESNYGPKITLKESGNLVGPVDNKMKGTSQATAIATGKFVKAIEKERKKESK